MGLTKRYNKTNEPIHYLMIKLAADGQKRNLSNFIEFATMQYLTSSQFVDSDEM